MNQLETVELDELNELLNTEEPIEEVRERFQIKDLSAMNWALRKLSALEKSHREDTDLLNAEYGRITKWYDKQSHSYNGSKDFLEGLIKEYAATQRVIDPKWKGSKTPYGAVGFRKQSKWDYGDEKALVKYLETSFSFLLKVEKTPMKAEIKKDFIAVNGKAVNKITGEILPGISINELDPVVTIKLEG